MINDCQQTARRGSRRAPGLVPITVTVAIGGTWPVPASADNSFLPHAVCYLWDWRLLALHAVTDLLIGLSYVAISATLAYLVYRARRDIPFHWILLAFGAFIVACGITHFMELWTLWSARYWLSGSAKVVTAIASVATALVLPPLVPRALALIGDAKVSAERKHHLEQAHVELERLYRRVTEVDRLKTQFFANVSHELRTPLTLILGPVDRLVGAANLSEEQRRELTVVHGNARMLLKHVNDLLDVSKLEAGKMGLAYAQLDLAELTRFAAGHFELLAVERRIRYAIETPERLPAQVDPGKLQRVLVNLLSNAFKFTPDGGRVRCALGVDGTEAHLVVEDSGPGVSPALRDAIFDRFRQGDEGATRRYEGTGLGLAIAKDFVELHGGRIGVTDGALGGAAFVAAVPLLAPAGALVHVPPAFIGESEVAQQALDQARRHRILAPVDATRMPAEVAATPATRADLPVVLLVEDNLEMAAYLATALGADCRLEIAHDGLEGVRKALDTTPDLVVTDVMMPGMSGDQLVQELRRHRTLDAVPIMLVTAKADDDLRARMLREGAQDYVTKPFAAEELRARTANLLTMSQARRVLQRELATQGQDLAALARELAARSRELQAAEATARERREWLEVTLRSIGDAVIVTDPAGQIRFVNSVAESVTQWRAADAAGRHLDEVFRIVNEQTREPVESPVSRLIREGTVVGLANHTVLLAGDGTDVPIDDSGAPIRDDAGALVGVVLVFRDITVRRQAERERADLLERELAARAEAEAAQRRVAFLADAGAVLASSLDVEATLRAVARMAVPYLADWCAVYLVHEGGELARVSVVHADPAREKLADGLGRRLPPRADAPYGPGRVAVTGQAELHPEIDEAFEASMDDPGQRALIRQLGVRSYLGVPLAAGGRILGAMTFCFGDSGRRHGPEDLALAEALARRASLAIENAQLYCEAQAANRAKDEFLATLSHELRTPLNSMLGWAEMLKSGRLDAPTTARALDSIERNTRAQVQLIDDLLDVSRIISGKLRLDIRPVDLIPVLEAAVEATRAAANGRAIHLELRLDPQVGPVPGDPDRLQQVVWNLLSNAIKFTPKGGRVEVSLERANSRARIRVRDTGQGIAPDFLPYIFDRFRQAESQTTRVHGGLGLGLAIVRHLVDQHGGTVFAESDGLEHGATFTVELPIRAAEPHGAYGEWAPGALMPSARFEAPPVLEGLRVLVVDDEPDARDLLGTILRQCRAVVTTAASAAEALALFERQSFDVLLSDIGLPGEDGYSLIRSLRAREVALGHRTLAIALTAYARSEDRKLALLAGFQFHVAKPVQPVELVGVVATVAAMRRTPERPATPGPDRTPTE